MRDSNLLTLGVFLLVFACIITAIMVARGDPDTRRLEGRIKSLNPGGTGPTGGSGGVKAPPRSIRKTSGGSALVRAMERMGRSRHIPSDRRIAWPVIVAGAAVSAAAATYLGTKIIGAAVAPVLAVAAALFFVHLMFKVESSRYKLLLFNQLPDAMGLILRAIRAGLPMGEALANVARELQSPSREEFAQVVNNIGIGQSLDAALFGLADRSGLTEYYFFSVTVGLQAQTGGNLGETIENLAEMVRKRVALVGRIKALTAEARISAIILAALPFVAGAAMALFKPGHFDPLLDTDSGFRLLLMGGTSLCVGMFAIRWLVKSAVKD